MKAKEVRRALNLMSTRNYALTDVGVAAQKDADAVVHRPRSAGHCPQARWDREGWEREDRGAVTLSDLIASRGSACSNCLPVLELEGVAARLGEALEYAHGVLVGLDASKGPNWSALEAAYESSKSLRYQARSQSLPGLLKGWFADLSHAGAQAALELGLSAEDLSAVAAEYFRAERPAQLSVLEDSRWTLVSTPGEIGLVGSARGALVTERYGFTGGVIAPAPEALMAVQLERRLFAMETVPAGVSPAVVETIEALLADGNRDLAMVVASALALE